MFRSVTLTNALLLCLLLGGFAWGDSVKLKSAWRRFNGHVVSVNAQSVVFTDESGKRLTWPRDQVSDIRFEAEDVPPGVIPARPANPVTSGAVPPKPPLTAFKPAVPPVPSNAPPIVTASPAEPNSALSWIARFNGAASKTGYLGLYRFGNRGTCWMTLPQPLMFAKQIQFDLLGKWSPAQGPPEGFPVSARFMDATGKLIDEAPVTYYQNNRAALLEWFDYLDGMAGVSTPQRVSWIVPPRTKTIEWVIPAQLSQGANQLLGYISRVQLN